MNPFDNDGLKNVVDSVKNEILISDITLRSFITQQCCKMTTRLCQICGYELCIIPKDMQIDFNRFRTNIVSYL